MSSTALPSRPVAPLRHTLVILGVLALIALAGARNSLAAGTAAPGNHIGLYLGLIVGEWLLFWGICRGLAQGGSSWRELFGRGLDSWPAFARMALLGALTLGLLRLTAWGAHAALAGLGLPVAADAARVQAAVEPHGALEQALWIVLSLSAGICEEFAYRGYLLRQFAAWWGGPAVGVLVSGLVFGLSHAYQGPWQVIVIALGYGIPCGVVAVLTRSLVPTSTAHALEDAISGLFGV